MTAFLYQRLACSGLIPRDTLVRALSRCLVRQTSLCEALIGLDVVYARAISLVIARQGPTADEGWRPDPRLVTQLPPGMCEQYLTFPFRERGFDIELVTLCPSDRAVAREFEMHLGRSVVLYRARLQALLAAANAPVDLNALARFLSQPPPPDTAMALPLLRKHQKRRRRKHRVPTSPGLGSQQDQDATAEHPDADDAAASAPSSLTSECDLLVKHERLTQAHDLSSLALTLGQVLPPPTLIFEHGRDQLRLQVTSGKGADLEQVLSLELPSALRDAHAEGEYWGPFYSSPVHSPFFSLFPRESLVFVARLGGHGRGLVVVCSGQIGVHEARGLLETARRRAAGMLQ